MTLTFTGFAPIAPIESRLSADSTIVYSAGIGSVDFVPELEEREGALSSFLESYMSLICAPTSCLSCS